MFMVLSSWPKSLREFTSFIWWMLTERHVAANPHTKPVDLGCESTKNWQLPSTSTVNVRQKDGTDRWMNRHQVFAFCLHGKRNNLACIAPCVACKLEICCWKLAASNSNACESNVLHFGHSSNIPAPSCRHAIKDRVPSQSFDDLGQCCF